jgi:hypothetical protein
MLSLNTVLALARKHLGTGAMESSARLCLSDAITLMERETPDYSAARARAIRSLAYSVRILHPDYRRASKGA